MRNNPTASMALPTEFFIILVSCLVRELPESLDRVCTNI